MPTNSALHKKTNNTLDLEKILNLKITNNQLRTKRLSYQGKLQSPTKLKKPVRLINWKNLTNQLRSSRPTNRRKTKSRTNQGTNLESQVRVVKVENLEKVMRVMNQPSLEKPRLQKEIKFQETTTKV